MKLIIEKLGGAVYAYTETEKHFKRVEPGRGTERLDPSKLGIECNLHQYDDFHMVFEVKKGRHAKR
jgi:hypothetical protein